MFKLCLSIILSITYFTVLGQTILPVQPAFDFLTTYPNVRDVAISIHGNEAYFTVQSPLQEISLIAFSKQNNNEWTKPEIVSFSSQYNDLEPFLSPDQLKLFFASNRPLNDSTTKAKDYDIWYVERKTVQDTWSKPINVGSPINTAGDEFFPSVSRHNTMFFTLETSNGYGKDDIFYSQWNGKNYEKPVLLDSAINSAGYEFNAYISPNEDLLIYTKYATPDGFGSGDLYFSLKNKDGKWNKAENLGKTINSKYMEYCPFYDEKNELLYFTSRRSALIPRKFDNLNELLQSITQYENGFSRLYKVSFKNPRK
jgi:hypothetical protein